MQYQEERKVMVSAYTHNLSKGLVSALRQLVDFFEANYTRANLDKDLNLTYNQQSNFQKLKYFGLVTRNSDGRLPTKKGVHFIYGYAQCYDRVATLGQDILSYDHEARNTHKKKPTQLYVYEIDEMFYKKRPEYASEKYHQQATLLDVDKVECEGEVKQETKQDLNELQQRVIAQNSPFSS